jgi:hypothetical protein
MVKMRLERRLRRSILRRRMSASSATGSDSLVEWVEKWMDVFWNLCCLDGGPEKSEDEQLDCERAEYRERQECLVLVVGYCGTLQELS